jgi:hypothetical protein
VPLAPGSKAGPKTGKRARFMAANPDGGDFNRVVGVDVGQDLLDPLDTGVGVGLTGKAKAYGEESKAGWVLPYTHHHPGDGGGPLLPSLSIDEEVARQLAKQLPRPPPPKLYEVS